MNMNILVFVEDLTTASRGGIMVLAYKRARNAKAFTLLFSITSSIFTEIPRHQYILICLAKIFLSPRMINNYLNIFFKRFNIITMAETGQKANAIARHNRARQRTITMSGCDWDSYIMLLTTHLSMLCLRATSGSVPRPTENSTCVSLLQVSFYTRIVIKTR